MPPKKMLIAEDDINILELLRMYMEKEGFQVETAVDGGEALAKYRRFNPDIILLDVMMPVLDGVEVCASIRRESKVPIIMLTAKGETDDKVHGLESGADDYIPKPFEMREVIARIRAVLRRTDACLEEPNDKRVELDNLVIDIESYQLIVKGVPMDIPPKELELPISLPKMPIRCLQGIRCSIRFGALNTLATRARWTCILSVCAKNWKGFPTNGR